MLLEFTVWGSKAWYDKAIPMLEKCGLSECADLAWSDPDTDGEKMGCYYDYTAAKDGLDPAHLADVLANIKKIVMASEAPEIEIKIVATPAASA